MYKRQDSTHIIEAVKLYQTLEKYQCVVSVTSRETLEALFDYALEYTHDTLISSLPEGQEEAMLSRLERDLSAEGPPASAGTSPAPPPAPDASPACR